MRRLLDPSHPREVADAVPVLTAARLVSNTAYRFAPPFLAVIGRGLGVPLGSMGLAVSVAELGGLAAPFLGRRVDRRSRRAAMVAGLLFMAGAGAVAAGAPAVGALALGLLGLSLGKIVYDTAMAAWIGDRVTYALRGEVTGLTETSWAGALLLGIPLLALVTAGLGWRAAYLVASAGLVAIAATVRARLPHDPSHHDPATVAPRAPLDRHTVPAFVSYGFLMTASQCVFVVFGAWWEDAFGFGTVTIGVLAVLLGIAELIASTSSIRLTDRVGKKRAVAFGTALMLPATVALTAVGGRAAFGVAGMALFVLVFEFAIVSAMPLVSELAPGARGSAIGIAIGAGTVGRGLAAIATTRLYTAHGIGGSALLAAGCAAVSVTLLVLFVREPRLPSTA